MNQDRRRVGVPPDSTAIMRPMRATNTPGANVRALQAAQPKVAATNAQSESGAKEDRYAKRPVDLYSQMREGNVPVTLDRYLQSAMSSMLATESAISNPLNLASSASSSVISSAVPVVDRQSRLLPVGNSGVFDERILINTGNLMPAREGFPAGVVSLRYSDFSTKSAPTGVISITIHEFCLPRAYNVPTVAYDCADLLYHQKIFMTLGFLPADQMYHTNHSNSKITYELRIKSFNKDVIIVEPTEPTFVLSSPIDISNDISISFQVYDLMANLVAYPIPPTRIPIVPVLPITGYPTSTFKLPSYVPISALAPAGSSYTVMVKPINADGSIPAAPFDSTWGMPASNFLANGTFTLPVALAAAPAQQMYVVVPKNTFSFTIRFVCARNTKTNDLVPIHV